MILVDTSVWIDHFRSGEAELVGLLHADRVLSHPFVVGELACGNLRERAVTLRWFDRLADAPLASPVEVRTAIEELRLFGRGIGYVDAHVLVSARLLPGTTLWTRDGRLHAVAVELGIARVEPTRH